MIALTKELLIGNSYDEEHATQCINYEIKAILNVAYDMPRGQFSEKIEYSGGRVTRGTGWSRGTRATVTTPSWRG